jgi:hypothetical protein
MATYIRSCEASAAAGRYAAAAKEGGCPTTHGAGSRSCRRKPIKTLICPNCGLVLTIRRDPDVTQLTYDTKDWQQRCKDLKSDSAVLYIVKNNSSRLT